MKFSESLPQKYDLYIRNNNNQEYNGWFIKDYRYPPNKTFLLFINEEGMGENKRFNFLALLDEEQAEVSFSIDSFCDNNFLKYYFKVK